MSPTNVNFTGTVDRDLLKRLKVLAAKLATSINALFNAELRHLVETYEAAEAHGNHNFQTLLDCSLGRINDIQAMEQLGGYPRALRSNAAPLRPAYFRRHNSYGICHLAATKLSGIHPGVHS